MRSVQEAVTCDVMSELGATGVSINEADCWLPNPRRPLMVVTKDPTLHPVTSWTGACQGRKYRWGSAVPFVWVYILLVQVLCKPVLRFLSSCSSLLAATKVEVEVEVQGKIKIKIRNKDNYNTCGGKRIKKRRTSMR